MSNNLEQQQSGNPEPPKTTMNTDPASKPRRPLSECVLTSAQLARLTPEDIRRIRGTYRRPVWRYWYDPYAGPPVAQTVAEALANAAKAPPGTIPEVEMLTPAEVEQREAEIRSRPPPVPAPRKAAAPARKAPRRGQR